MTRKPPAFLFYPDSWVLGTANLSLLEQGIYLRLLCYQWAHGPFPFDRASPKHMLKACLLASNKHVLEHVLRVLELKFETDGTRYWNARLEEERLRAQARGDRAKTAAESRWGKQKPPETTVATGARKHPTSICLDDATNTNTKTKIKKKKEKQEKESQPAHSGHSESEPPIPLSVGKQSRAVGKGFDRAEAAALGWPEPLIDMVESWLAYKRERGERYKPTGLQKFISRVQARVLELGESEVRQRMERAMAANWAGWDFELQQPSRAGAGKPAAAIETFRERDARLKKEMLLKLSLEENGMSESDANRLSKLDESDALDEVNRLLGVSSVKRIEGQSW